MDAEHRRAKVRALLEAEWEPPKKDVIVLSAKPAPAQVATIDFRNTNALWGSIFAETLARCGVRTAVISPGSRSTPLTIALAANPKIEAVPVLDERSAAFFALGLAKRTRTPVVLLCTSGTAGANYLPAIIEAQESGAPLLAITADRPPELRDCASGQTIDQQKLFGGHVNHFHELAVPEPTRALLAYLRQTVAHAVERTVLPVRGPVHLNAPFRDPLPPVPDESARALEGTIDETFFAHLEAARPAATTTTTWQRPTGRGLIVAGAASPEQAAVHAAKVLELAEALGWPVLADVQSPVRTQAAAAGRVVTMYDAVLRDPKLARELEPRMVLCLGGWPTSKVLRSWLEASGAEILLVAASPENRDALHGRTRQILASVESLAVAGERTADEAYIEKWRQADAAAWASIDAAMDRPLPLLAAPFEGKAAWLLGRVLPEGTPVFVANSMPVRDVEYFWPANGRGHEFYFNRGANGIDGTLSTALGVAHGAGRPAVALTGDLAFLHDANGLLSRPVLRGSLTVVLINNRGGGIFEHLPVAEFEPPFERFFATPQEVEFATLCAAHGVAHTFVSDWEQFVRLVSVLPTAGVRVLELRTDRKRDAAMRKAWLNAAGAAAKASAGDLRG